MKTAIQVILFIITNWSQIYRFVSELIRLFGDDKAKIDECIDGLCNAAQKVPAAPPVVQKRKKPSLVEYIRYFSRLKKKQ